MITTTKKNVVLIRFHLSLSLFNKSPQECKCEINFQFEQKKLLKR